MVSQEPSQWASIFAILLRAAPNHTKEPQCNQSEKHPHYNKRPAQTTLQEFSTGEEREANSLNPTRKKTLKRQANSEDVS